MIAFLDLDRDNDLLYIALDPRVARTRGCVSHSERRGENIVLDFDRNDRLVGIEVMDASKVIGVPDLTILSTDSFLGVKEAAALAGVEKPNFIRDYAGRPDFPKPLIQVASGPIWFRPQVEEFLRRRKKREARPSKERAS